MFQCVLFIGIFFDSQESISCDSLSGHCVEQYILGKEHYRKNNHKEAFQCYHEAANQGYARAYYRLGNCFLKGKGTEKNLFLATNCFKKGAAQGHTKAQYALGNCYESGQVISIQEHLELINGKYSYRPKKRKYLEDAFKCYQQAANRGHKKAQYRLGNCYRYGNGVPEDLSKSLDWYNKAAAQGYGKAINFLAEIDYNLGNYLKEHYRTTGNIDHLMYALSCYQKAVKQGHLEAQCSLMETQFSLGNYYRTTGVIEDIMLALDWYQKAADQGHKEAQQSLMEAQFSLGNHYRDVGKLIELCKMAANQSYIEAQLQLENYYCEGQIGILYHNGEVISRDLTQV